MAAADAQVLVSTNECSPLVNLESILLGTIVISSRVHGIPEVVVEGERGFLVEPEDVESIRAGLERFDACRRLDPAQLDRMRIAALDYVASHHDLSHLAAILQREIVNLLHLKAVAGSAAPLPKAVNDYLGMHLNERWSLAKNDAAFERHFFRHHAHHLYRPDPS